MGLPCAQKCLACFHSEGGQAEPRAFDSAVGRQPRAAGQAPLSATRRPRWGVRRALRGCCRLPQPAGTMPWELGAARTHPGPLSCRCPSSRATCSGAASRRSRAARRGGRAPSMTPPWRPTEQPCEARMQPFPVLSTPHLLHVCRPGPAPRTRRPGLEQAALRAAADLRRQWQAEREAAAARRAEHVARQAAAQARVQRAAAEARAARRARFAQETEQRRAEAAERLAQHRARASRFRYATSCLLAQVQLQRCGRAGRPVRPGVGRGCSGARAGHRLGGKQAAASRALPLTAKRLRPAVGRQGGARPCARRRTGGCGASRGAPRTGASTCWSGAATGSARRTWTRASRRRSRRPCRCSRASGASAWWAQRPRRATRRTTATTTTRTGRSSRLATSPRRCPMPARPRGRRNRSGRLAGGSCLQRAADVWK